ncbi:hypothetical protein GCM10020256_51390 [Streptomyces thermocoprophilus]
MSRAMVLRATGPCSSTDRRMTLALVRRRSRSATRGTVDRGRGVAVRGMGHFLGRGPTLRREDRRAGIRSAPPHSGRRQAAVLTRRRSTWRRDEKYRAWATMRGKLAKRRTAAQTPTDG